MKPAELPKSLPAPLAELLDDYRWSENHIGMSETRIFRLSGKNKRPLYLKIAPAGSKLSLAEEKRRLGWLKNRLPVPETLLFAEDETNAYLLISEISGVPASDDSLKTDVSHVIEQLVAGLKMIHAVPVENCPFKKPLAEKIEAARQRMLENLVDEEDFDEERVGRTAADVFDEMASAIPQSYDPVFAHGDYCVPNVILENRKLSGFVDWAEAGVADRYQDLALLSRSVKHNFGAEYENAVFELYGTEPDWEKVRFYRLLDEFF